MSIHIPARVSAFMHLELTTSCHPERDRLITLPRSAPVGWAIDAYLLSIGREPREQFDYEDEPESFDEWPYRYRRGGEYRSDEFALEDHRPDVRVSDAVPPEIGTPLVSVTLPGEGRTADRPSAEDWLTAEAPFREDDVNRELLQRHGVVRPFFDDLDMRPDCPGIRDSSPAATLLSALTPARRLALLGHLEEVLSQVAAPGLPDVEAAVMPFAELMRHLGVGGVAQEPSSGWLPDTDVVKLAEALGWGGDRQLALARGRVLVEFARESRVIRRYRGRVVATASMRRLVVAGRGTLDALAGLIGASTRDRYGYPLPRREAEIALALLAVADGSAAHLDAVADRVEAGIQAFDTRGLFRDYRFDDIMATRTPDLSDADGEVRRVLDALSCMSAPGRFGVVTPAMREVARRALA
ncbi:MULTISPECIES: hypothetical protein [unclassified Microbacterium]|uniref:hypothetical protein n=1 Tax=unclassified Microbacterium TaxID=2609290 RepID=UPI00343072AB